MRHTLKKALEPVAVVVAIVVGSVLVSGQTWGPLTPLFNLRGRTDANGALRVYASAASGAQGPLTPLGNLRGRTDANGALRVALVGGDATPARVLAGDGTALLPAYSFASNPDSGGYISGSQMRWSVDGVLVSALSATNYGIFGTGMYYAFPNGSQLGEGAAGNFTLKTTGGTIGSQFKVDALPTVASGFGTSPAVTAGSTPLAGEVVIGTGGIATTGTITFGGTAFPAAAFCTCQDQTTLAAGLQKCLATTTQLVITTTVAWAAADRVQWHCISPK